MEHTLAGTVFVVTLIATFVVSWLAQRHARLAGTGADSLDGRRLNRWLVGLSAAATANSGFVVTGAVGLGYAYGTQWLLLPIAWLLGDLLFWQFFPHRLNSYGRQHGVTTLSELITAGLQGRLARLIALAVAVVILMCLGGYTSAQWLAGQKFLVGAFGIPKELALVGFALLIISYTAIGGFRGSVYADTLQAVIRLVGTVVALVAVGCFAFKEGSAFESNLAAAGPGFISWMPAGGLPGLLGFFAGFAAAALGFGLGQPQLVSRYLAGRTPHETAAAKWIYIGFVQFTWLSMTLFGVVLRGVMPDLADPETGLSAFFTTHIHPLATGVILADIFATIASTTNSLLVAMSQCFVHDLFRSTPGKGRAGASRPILVILLIGVGTLVASLVLQGSVLSLALGSISLMAAGLAPTVMIKLLGWRHNAASIAVAMGVGIGAAVAWKMVGYGAWLNEAAVGMLLGVIANAGVVALKNKPS